MVTKVIMSLVGTAAALSIPGLPENVVIEFDLNSFWFDDFEGLYPRHRLCHQFFKNNDYNYQFETNPV